MKLQVATLARAASTAEVALFVLEAGPLSEEEIAARTLRPLADVRVALDLMVSRGDVRESRGVVTRRRRR